MDPLVRAIKTLTIAVWCLCGLVGVQVAFYGAGYLRSFQWMRRAAAPADKSVTVLSPSRKRPEVPGSEFHQLPPEQKVKLSSAILLVSYQKAGDRYKAVVAEILKHDPDATLYYNVGDEMAEMSYYPRSDESRGEGQVVFMVGSPAEMRSSYSFDSGRIGGMGDMPLDLLRQMVRGAKP